MPRPKVDPTVPLARPVPLDLTIEGPSVVPFEAGPEILPVLKPYLFSTTFVWPTSRRVTLGGTEE